jgi:pimeloyl-ACP methyl ester carboxylesterase
MKQFLTVLTTILLVFSCATNNPNKAAVQLWKTLPDLPAMPLPDESGFAPVNGIKMYYAIFNKQAARTVLLLHGGLGSSDYWAFEVPLLSKTHKVIVVDSRGHGRSTMTLQSLTYNLMASDVFELMNYLKIEKPSIVGWSDGGIIGLILAIHHPELVNKLFTYGSNYNRSGYSSEPVDSGMRARFISAVQSNYRKLSPTPDSFSSLASALQKMYSAEPDLNPEDLKMIKAPTVIAGGEHDFITQEHFKELAGLIPGAKMVILPNVGHGGPLQDPVHFHKAVMKLLDGN